MKANLFYWILWKNPLWVEKPLKKETQCYATQTGVVYPQKLRRVLNCGFTVKMVDPRGPIIYAWVLNCDLLVKKSWPTWANPHTHERCSLWSPFVKNSEVWLSKHRKEFFDVNLRFQRIPRRYTFTSIKIDNKLFSKLTTHYSDKFSPHSPFVKVHLKIRWPPPRQVSSPN